MTTETQTLDPAAPPVDPAVAAAAAAAVVDPAAAAELPAADPAIVDPQDPPAADPADPKPHGNKGRKPWYLDRISEETNARQQAEERARNAEALLERSTQTRNQADPAAATATTRTDETAIEARARQIADERINGDKINAVIRSGIAKFPDWDQRAEMLGAVGAATPAFVLDVVSVDPVNAHLILHQLADDPQKASHLAKMDTRNRTIELVKMSMAASSQTAPAAPPAEPKPAVPPKTVSKAPAPPPPVEPGASQVVDWRSDKVSDQEFARGWEENARQRAAKFRK